MYTFFKRAGIVFLVLAVVFILVGLFLPTTYNVSRVVRIEAPPAVVWPLVADLKNWKVWSPWEEEDPTIKTTLGAQTTGVGASMSWTGKSGNGRLVIQSVVPKQALVTDLYFMDDADKAEGSFTLVPEGEGVKVTWSMAGQCNVPILGGYLATFLMPNLIGPMFDRGLEKMKAAAEATPDEPLLQEFQKVQDKANEAAGQVIPVPKDDDELGVELKVKPSISTGDEEASPAPAPAAEDGN